MLNTDMIYKIIHPFKGGFLTIIGGVIGYFAGIHKERLNIKWKEKREAFRKLYCYCETINIDEGIVSYKEQENLLPLKYRCIIPKKHMDELDGIISKIVEKYENDASLISTKNELDEFKTKIKKELE